MPETVRRPEGPFGPGSVQRFVHEDGASHYFTLRDDPRWHAVLMQLCAFDIVANNADRKSGHVLLAEDRLWAIDNGLCFNEHEKLRTVIWDFGGATLEPGVQEDLARLAHDGPPAALCDLIDPAEVAATLDRVRLAAQPARPARAGRRRRLAALPLAPRLTPLAPRPSRGAAQGSGTPSSAARRSPAAPRPGSRRA